LCWKLARGFWNRRAEERLLKMGLCISLELFLEVAKSQWSRRI
jgi:hypothetical protein